MSVPLLLGPASLDRWLDEGRVLPGGGALNMAYHWSRLGQPFTLLTRIGDDHAELFLAFLRRHGIAHTPTIVAHGSSSSIDILIESDRQPWMDNFVEGVWTGYSPDEGERAMVTASSQLHVVLVHSVVTALHQMHADGLLGGVSVSGDFLSLRRYTIEQFERTMALLDVGVIGWPGEVDDPFAAATPHATTGRNKPMSPPTTPPNRMTQANSRPRLMRSSPSSRQVFRKAVAVTSTPGAWTPSHRVWGMGNLSASSCALSRRSGAPSTCASTRASAATATTSRHAEISC